MQNLTQSKRPNWRGVHKFKEGGHVNQDHKPPSGRGELQENC